jgi:hypothetical protein
VARWPAPAPEAVPYHRRCPAQEAVVRGGAPSSQGRLPVAGPGTGPHSATRRCGPGIRTACTGSRPRPRCWPRWRRLLGPARPATRGGLALGSGHDMEPRPSTSTGKNQPDGIGHLRWYGTIFGLLQNLHQQGVLGARRARADADERGARRLVAGAQRERERQAHPGSGVVLKAARGTHGTSPRAPGGKGPNRGPCYHR